MGTEWKPWYLRASVQTALLAVLVSLAVALAELGRRWLFADSRVTLELQAFLFLGALAVLLAPAVPLACWLRSLRLRRAEREESAEARIRWEIERYRREQEDGADRDGERA